MLQGLRLVKPTTVIIPSLRIFGEVTLSEYYDRFFRDRNIESVVLPLIEDHGFYFPYTIENQTRPGLTVTEPDTADETSMALKDVAEYFVNRGLKLIFSIDASMPELSMDSGACDIVDQADNKSAHCCINNRTTALYIGILTKNASAVLPETVRQAVSGFLLNLTDVWPMSARSGRFLLSCFCPSCIDDLRLNNSHLDPDWFKAFPNCANLALAETRFVDEDGESFGSISHVSNLAKTMSADYLLRVCAQRRGTAAAESFDSGTFDVQRAQLTRWAKQLQIYLGAKSSLTIRAVSSIFGVLRETFPSAERIVLATDDAYSWTNGLFAEDITTLIADEVWIPISSLRSSIPRRAILARRSCYFIQSFFATLHMCTNRRLRVSFFMYSTNRTIRKTLRRSADQALAEIQAEGGSILPPEITREDGITVGIDSDIVNKLLQRAYGVVDSIVDV